MVPPPSIGFSLSAIMEKGRWAVHKSATHYIQEGPALLADTHIPKRVAELAVVLTRNVGSYLYYAVTHIVGFGYFTIISSIDVL